MRERDREGGIVRERDREGGIVREKDGGGGIACERVLVTRTCPHGPTNRFIPKDRNDYPLVQISRIDGHTLVSGGSVKANRKFQIGRSGLTANPTATPPPPPPSPPPVENVALI